MNSDTLTHWKKLTDPRFFGVYALPNEAEDLTVTISHVTFEEVTMMGGKKEMHTIVHLVDQKPLMINKTNSLSIEKLHSPYIEQWAGKSITLHASTTSLGREKNVPCIRVRPTVMVTNKKKFITDERIRAALVQIKQGKYSIAKLRATFEITEEQEEIINQFQEQSE